MSGIHLLVLPSQHGRVMLKGSHQGEAVRYHLRRRRKMKKHHEGHEGVLDQDKGVETHADLEGSDTHLDPLESGYK